jgi:hypothetical protein
LATAGAWVLLAAAVARADLVPWSYNWTPGAPAVLDDTADGGKITMTNEPTGKAVGSSDIVATNLKTYSKADPASPDQFTNKGYSLVLALTDNDSHQAGTLTFTGVFNGTISAQNSNITNTFTGPATQKLLLGHHLYTVTIGQFTPPAPPGSVNSGSISATAQVSVNPVPVSQTPEPSGVVLAGLGLSCLGLVSWRKSCRGRKAR